MALPDGDYHADFNFFDYPVSFVEPDSDFAIGAKIKRWRSEGAHILLTADDKTTTSTQIDKSACPTRIVAVFPDLVSR